ncbi:hypothetical protein SERLADRAFT_448068 [Serpula lacrymans var. lacrymans S7.9]|uniref:Uncharacterized protein n=1 Tax=Serpula lacrymans var. lacrymans (strain S7.9) TaxID=578457 RepID=F8NSH5_SERL9|nr:uncharacterized protein SERLADRAFT_448068 [Serpula lacrymans var. lacrymans S7.9]EGO26953.1 hypothetical protein SERLADRAFT_448068 [Serpula lacrymans var. lacrymans S7.9]
MTIVNLDDVKQTVVCIPYADPEGEDEDVDKIATYQLFQHRDLPDGYQLRLNAYRVAWSKCLSRIQEIIHTLHTPVIDNVVELVKSAYSDTLPGLPYYELPVITVTASTLGSTLLEQITSRLEGDSSVDGLFETLNETYVTHLFPTDCSTIMSAMKSLVAGFLTRPLNNENVKRKVGTSLAAFDIKLLQAWYDAISESHGETFSTDDPVQLVVVLHDFEQLEPTVVQDIFEICSLHIPALPLVFILSLSSPSSPSFLHSTYPRSCLSLLHVRNCDSPPAEDALHEILMKTFFDVDFEPDVMIGPSSIDFLVELFTRHNTSLDSVASILQLTHMKHFEEPLSVFAIQSPFTTIEEATMTLHHPSSAFLESILARMQCPDEISLINHVDRWRDESVSSLLESIDTAHLNFRKRARLMRVAFQLYRSIQQFLLRQGHKTAQGERNLPEMMCAAMKGTLVREGKYLSMMVKFKLEDFLQSIPEDIRLDEEDIRSQNDTAIEALRASDISPEDASKVADLFGDWLTSYFQRRLVSLDETTLWDIWYTGSTPFPSELINPSVRATIFSGLLYPQDYLTLESANGLNKTHLADLSELSDTSILFSGYLESGKMINVYDWFESFSATVENQKSRVKRPLPTPTTRRPPSTPSKGKSRHRQTTNDVVEELVEPTEEEWKMEVQARFVRALHELDYLGFIKHTGRKADHVMKTVFEPPEPE